MCCIIIFTCLVKHCWIIRYSPIRLSISCVNFGRLYNWRNLSMISRLSNLWAKKLSIVFFYYSFNVHEFWSDSSFFISDIRNLCLFSFVILLYRLIDFPGVFPGLVESISFLIGVMIYLTHWSIVKVFLWEGPVLANFFPKINLWLGLMILETDFF